jgi:hypothetical protein
MEYGHSDEGQPHDPLVAVSQAAGERLRAETEADEERARQAAEALLSAATGAMAAGCPLGAIAAAEIQGQRDVRDELRGDALRRVERSGERARQARIDHHAEIARSIRLGLSTREIAVAASVTHGTIRAIGARVADLGPADEAEPEPQEQPEEQHHDTGEQTPWGGY